MTEMENGMVHIGDDEAPGMTLRSRHRIAEGRGFWARLGPPRPWRSRGDQGAALVEFAIMLPFLAVLVFGVIDLGRAWQLQNRMSNAAREGAAVAQFLPHSVATGCRSGNNVVDRATQEEPALSLTPGFAVSVAKVGATVQQITGCETSTVSVAPGDTLRVTVSAQHDVITPFIGAITGDPIVVTRSIEVVMQG